MIQISAGDSDSNPEFSSVTYSLKDEQFIHSTEDRIQSTDQAFKIDQSTGVVVTNLRSYIPYIGGYFQMVVVATDSEGRTAEADLFVSKVLSSSLIYYYCCLFYDWLPDMYFSFLSLI